jgi:hypothetical protein
MAFRYGGRRLIASTREIIVRSRVKEALLDDTQRCVQNDSSASKTDHLVENHRCHACGRLAVRQRKPSYHRSPRITTGALCGRGPFVPRPMRMSKVEIGSKLCNRFQASHGKEIDHVKWVRKLSDYWGNMRIVVVQWERRRRRSRFHHRDQRNGVLRRVIANVKTSSGSRPLMSPNIS